MIIQCEKCSTRFRFDDELMEKEGVWVRCGQCKHEFFQKNPSSQSGTALRQSNDSPQKTQEREAGASASPASSGREDTPTKGAADEKKSARQDESGRKTTKTFLKILVLFTLTWLLVVAGLWSYMQVSGIKIQDLISKVPYLDKIIAAEDPSVLKLTQIRIDNLKQRYVKTWMGDVLVVEGIAWNSAPFPVARIMVVATLYDANGMELARKEAFAGNILTPLELETFPEEAIERELSLSHGRDTSNDRIESHGRIPFMIVFTKIPPGVAKTKVYVAGTEKLVSS